MKLKSGFKIANIENDKLVIEVGGDTVDLRTALQLNPTAQLLFEALAEECDEEGLVNILLATYDVDEAAAKRDVSAFILQMKEKDMLI